jgi:hypothetical protein
VLARRKLARQIIGTLGVPDPWRRVFTRGLLQIIKTSEQNKGITSRRAPSRTELTKRLTKLIAGLKPMVKDGDEASFIAAALLDGDKADVLAAGIRGRALVSDMLDRAERAKAECAASEFASGRGGRGGGHDEWLEFLSHQLVRLAAKCDLGDEWRSYKGSNGKAAGSMSKSVQLVAEHCGRYQGDAAIVGAIERAKHLFNRTKRRV